MYVFVDCTSAAFKHSHVATSATGEKKRGVQFLPLLPRASMNLFITHVNNKSPVSLVIWVDSRGTCIEDNIDLRSLDKCLLSHYIYLFLSLVSIPLLIGD